LDLSLKLLFPVLQLLGFSLDMFLKREYKELISQKFRDFVLKYDPPEFKDIILSSASWASGQLASLVPNSIRDWSRGLYFGLMSILLTSSALALGRFIDLSWNEPISDFLSRMLVGLVPFSGKYNTELLYPINMIFDAISVGFTYYALIEISKLKSPIWRILIIILDIVIAVSTAFLTLTFAKLILLKDFTLAFAQALQSISYIWTKAGSDYDALFYASTTLIPTFFFWLFVVGIQLLHISNVSLKKVSKFLSLRLQENAETIAFRLVVGFFAAFASIVSLLLIGESV